jgi:hypothetical protein
MKPVHYGGIVPAMTDERWNALIDKIRENNVVPVVGPRLLIGADGQSSLQAEVAARLFTSCGVEPGGTPLTPFRELNEAVSLLKERVDRPQVLYDRVCSAIKDVTIGDATIPKPLAQLAEIADFRLMVTLTSDDLLARALRRYRAVDEIVHSPNLPTSEAKDLPSDWHTRAGDVRLLYLFGKARSAPMFAIHDEDVLEYAHNVIARGSHVPKVFLGELQQRNLLLLGCNFPDWLSRFFLRATNQKRLAIQDSGKVAWLIEPLKPEESLTCFLQSYSKDTEILSQMSPADFVAELHRRWMAAHGADTTTNGQHSAQPASPAAMFFISYSRTTDRSRAESLLKALMAHGVAENEVFIDRQSIEPGQDFQRRILDGIRHCRYFLPVLSEAADAREEGFVFSEWNEANVRFPAVNRDFVFPVIVDADYEPERYRAKPVRLWLDAHLDFAHAPDGMPDARFAKTLKKLVRSSRQGDRP